MKKIITILGTLLLGIGISNAYNVVGYGGQLEITPPDTAVVGNYTYVFNNNGNIATDGYGNVLNWYNNNNNNNYNYIYGWINGKLYFAGFYNNSVQKQGFVQKFSVCSEGQPTDSSKCTNLSLTADEFYELNPNITKLIVGATSANLQNFYGNEPFRLCYFNSNDSLYYCVQNAIRTQGYVDNPLSGSLSFTNIDSLNNGNWSSTPFSPTYTPTQPDTNDVCITVQQFFDMYGSTNNYNTGLCYTQDKYLTQTGRVQITPKFITELYPTYQEFRQDVNTRHNYCTPPATQQTCQQAFNGKEENRTLINKLQEGTDTAIIYDMCNIYQTRSGNMQKNFCDMTEEEAKIIGENTITTEKYAERIANNPTKTTTPTTGTVYDGLTDGTNRDILEAIPRVYTKITGIFKGRSGKNGIIPYYITGILLVIVLFKLFKK